MKRFLTFAWLLLGVLAAPTAYYPNGIGYSWTYSSGMEQVFTREQNGMLVFERRLANQPVSADLLRYTPDKGVLLEGLIVGQAVQRYNPPLQLYPAPPLVLGQEWGGRSNFGGQSVALLGKVLRIEGVNVPAGRFNAYVIRTSTVTSGGGSQVMEIFFVPGVGIVRYATPDGGTIDLVKFSVPK
ncbi:MAG: hypothetical protein N2Z75_00765 [Meiothermus sp.]|uniref:hypothetical protein n=1 Tax=Meiothermus sp. TaxID=1955249 RepID=UPI0025E83E48|nr:hypothetical protein [Meiothermus sp.]MCS7067375.1 hypothetical protein [Meiothermus sp.]MCX7600453.1 hypothetical protein [Meiothermus sp.]MDW8424662.1 hypothetical protein [Meiothermus sp.]